MTSMTRFAKKKASSSTQNCSVCQSRPLQCTWKSTKRPSQWVWVGNLSVWLCALQIPFQPQQVVCKQNTQVYTVCRCFSFDLRTFWMRKYRVDSITRFTGVPTSGVVLVIRMNDRRFPNKLAARTHELFPIPAEQAYADSGDDSSHIPQLHLKDSWRIIKHHEISA